MPHQEDLEGRLREAPEDEGAWLVYADWLLERGDARGEVIRLGHQIRAGGATPEMERRYAAVCRAARWPREGPWPRMCWRVRFERLVEELRARPEIEVQKAELGPPTAPDELARWRQVAGAAWPDGMTELYSELSRVRVSFRAEGGPEEGTHGTIALPALQTVWDYPRLQGLLWFDFLEQDHPFRSIRPIDMFVDEAYAVLYPVPPDGSASGPAEVAYHYCGEQLTATGLSYREWLELLMRARGVHYWLKLTLAPATRRTWVEEGVGRMAELFPDFDPHSMMPGEPREEVDLA
jgi:uncharacterized protein (TIGR02996 family)